MEPAATPPRLMRCPLRSTSGVRPMNTHPIRANLLRFSLPLGLLGLGSACSHRGPAAHVAGGVARYDRPVYAGHFLHSWEGGGVFIPCAANEAERRRPA